MFDALGWAYMEVKEVGSIGPGRQRWLGRHYEDKVKHAGIEIKQSTNEMGTWEAVLGSRCSFG
jgi:hypothetical protein